MSDAVRAPRGAAGQARREARAEALRTKVSVVGARFPGESAAEAQMIFEQVQHEARRAHALLEAQDPGCIAREARKAFDRRHEPDSLERRFNGASIDRVGVDYSLDWASESRGVTQLLAESQRGDCERMKRGLGAGRWGSVLHDTYSVAPHCDACGAAGSVAAPLRKCGACLPSFGALYCDAACAKRGWRDGGHKRACAAVRALLARAPLYVQRRGGGGDDDVAALLVARPALLAAMHAALRRYADVRCRNEKLHFFVQDGLLSPEAVVEKLRRGTFMPPPCQGCPAASRDDAFADDDDADAFYARPAEHQGLSRHEAWLLFAGLGESGAAARAADVALDALYCFVTAMWEARWAMRFDATPEQRSRAKAMTLHDMPLDTTGRVGV